jgi:hypothetical protein
LPPTNPVIQASYARVGNGSAYVVADPARPEDITARPLIPLLGEAALEVRDVEWPRITQAELDIILQRLHTRLGKVIAKLLSTRKGVPALKLVAPFAARIMPAAIQRSIRRSFLADLVKRDQIVEWVLPRNWANALPNDDAKRDYEQDTRAVIGAMLSPTFNLRTIDGLVLACDLEKARVQQILSQCAAADGKPYRIWQSDWFDSEDSRLVCLLSDRPGWIKRWLGQNHAGSFFFPPKIDPPVPKIPLDEVVAA